MTTLRDQMQAEAAALRAKADAIEAKIASIPAGLAGILEHDADEVVQVFRTLGEHLFHKTQAAAPAPAADAAATAAQ